MYIASASLRHPRRGFTIVELLIVIVVIGILAAITVGAYNGVKERSKFSKYRADLNSLNKAIRLFRADNGYYPVSSSWRGDNQTINDSFIPGIAPTYITNTPQVESNGLARPTFLYSSTADGSDFKLIYIVAYGTGEVLPAIHTENNPLIDPTRPTRAWGYWSSGGSSL